MKICSYCKLKKPTTEFYKNRSKKSGLSSYCTICVKKYVKKHPPKRPRRANLDRTAGLKRTYNITEEDYNKLLKNQGGKCAICESFPTKRRLAIDHDKSCCSFSKSCGKCIRGLLCMTCNTGIGKFKDSIDELKKAIEYLSLWRKSK
jgi:hypothetical protein